MLGKIPGRPEDLGSILEEEKSRHACHPDHILDPTRLGQVEGHKADPRKFF